MTRRIRVGQVQRKVKPPASSAVVAGGSGSVLTTKGDVHTYDTADVRLAVGTNDHVLTADSGQAKGVKWAAAPGGNPLTTKGDLFGYSTLAARIPIGTDTHVLTADSAQALGLKWAAGGSATIPFAKYDGPNDGDLSTTSGSFVTLGAYSVSIAAASGDELEVTFTGSMYTSPARNVSFQLEFNGTNKGPIWLQYGHADVTVFVVTCTYLHTVVAGDISGGNVPIDLEWKTSGSTAYWTNSNGLIGQLAVKNLRQ